ncbi:MAG: hypothetical protein DI623_06725 [Sphingomonas sanxanigenens]|uniref:Uncharacterized protein n=1 Tax=Sphingomonas sanxanigenens TaxID=397260 RepID=A0A2W5A7Q6_9SPHN|nr:MAG: hypothetical protein DI623_06725 [Sphingomonas sanxanigenens]
MFPVEFEIVVRRNRVRLTNLSSGGTIERSADPSFSSDHSIIADAAVLFDLLSDMTRQADRSWFRWLRLSVKGRFSIIGPTSANDVKALTSVAENIGFSKIEIATGSGT